MLKIDLTEAQKIINSGKDVSRQVILSQVHTLRRGMRELSQEAVEATLNGILLQEQARILLAYGKCFEDVQTESDRDLVIEVMTSEFQESCEEFVSLLT